MSVVTRFAPSPTGYLHIGGARTALFSWAWARKHGGRFLLRIEDTDLVRSRAAHSEAIIRSLQWLEMAPDSPPLLQSSRRARHQAVATALVERGLAYPCYCSSDELDRMRSAQIAQGLSPHYDRRWRDSKKIPPKGVTPTIRFKMPLSGQTTFEDQVKGTITVANTQLDDWIILRSDGTPTYNLAATVDDVDMHITHVIRGDDHVMNTIRQWHLFQSLAHKMPVFAHLPMILAADCDDSGRPRTNADGTPCYVRLSKRHAAVDIGSYRSDGFLPTALCNYLARLSWSHGDDEVFDQRFFIDHFSFSSVQVSAARFDMNKLRWVNREHLRRLPDAQLRCVAALADTVASEALEVIRKRATTVNDAKTEARIFEHAPEIPLAALQPYRHHSGAIADLQEALRRLTDWHAGTIKQTISQSAKAHQLPFKALGMPLRLMLTGRKDSADISTIAAILGQQETINRLQAGQRQTRKLTDD